MVEEPDNINNDVEEQKEEGDPQSLNPSEVQVQEPAADQESKWSHSVVNDEWCSLLDLIKETYENFTTKLFV